MIMMCAGTGQIMIARDEEEANYQESVDVWYLNLAASKKKTLHLSTVHLLYDKRSSKR